MPSNRLPRRILYGELLSGALSSWWPVEAFLLQHEANTEMLSHRSRTAWGFRLRPADLAWHLRFRPGDLPRRIWECGRESSCPTSSTVHRHLLWLPLPGLKRILCVGYRPLQPSPYPQTVTTTSVAGRRRRISTDYHKQAKSVSPPRSVRCGVPNSVQTGIGLSDD